MRALFLGLLCSTYARATTCTEEGRCRIGSSGQTQLCASAYWQDIVVGADRCINDQLLPMNPESVPTASWTSGTESRTSQPQSLHRATHTPGTTGHWHCLGERVPLKDDGLGEATYSPGGSMASVYDAGSGVFRCDIPVPDDMLYVAVWTRYEATTVSQSAPKNCNETLHLKNPKTGKTVSGLVIDRCASCVGVDHQTSDPTTPDYLVNGATIDLSPTLWSLLFDGAPYGVYDVEYNGPIYGGSWDGDPDRMTAPICA